MTPRTVLRIDNIGVLLSGGARTPRIDATTLYLAEGVIVGVGASSTLDERVGYVLDARGLMAAPGLWDIDHHLYFGDHTPWFDARGYLAATVAAGTTCVVAAAPAPLDGLPRDPQTTLQLALLTQRSWLHDRPHDMRVLASSLGATDGLTRSQLKYAAAQGIKFLCFSSPLSSRAVAGALAEQAVAAELRVIAHVGSGTPLADDARSIQDALLAINPQLVLGVNSGSAPPPTEMLHWLIEKTGAALGVSWVGNLRVARAIAARLAERGETHRLVIGTGTPSMEGILPGGVQRMIQALVGAGGLSAEVLLACASGNAARALGQSGGHIGVGEPADIILAAPFASAAYPDALAALADGSWMRIETVLIDGQVQLGGDAGVTQSQPALAEVQ